jgi:hypothetical protein
MSINPRLGLVAALLALPLAQAESAEPGPELPLPRGDRQTLEKSLGKGVVGKPVAAPVIADPSRYLALAAGAWTYRVVKGPHGRDSERYHWTAEPDGKHWRYDAGGEEIGFVESGADGSFFLTGVQEIRDDALTRYAPAEPLLLKGLAPGQERRLRMAVSVYDPDEPNDPAHEGALDVAYRYVGAYRLAAPIGVHEAVLVKSTFSGKVGPAVLNDVQYRFFAPGIGLLAMTEQREVSAFYLYNLRMEVGKLLASRPQ